MKEWMDELMDPDRRIEPRVSTDELLNYISGHSDKVEDPPTVCPRSLDPLYLVSY